jgi:hypothetical protein
VRSERARARSWWWLAAGMVAVVGWVAALFSTPPSALIASAVVFAAFALLFSAGVQTTRENRGVAAGPATADWRRLVDQTVLGTVGAIAALGLLQVSVSATLLLGAVLAGTAAWAFSWRRVGAGQPATGGPAAPTPRSGPRSAPGCNTRSTVARRTTPDASAAAEPVPPPALDLKSMTTTELVLTWRRSYSEFMRVRSAQQLAALAARRQQLLDELERRDSTGVERWLRSGARAASDPSRYLQRPTGPSATSA